MKITKSKFYTFFEYFIIIIYVLNSTMACWRYNPDLSFSPDIITYFLYGIILIYIFLMFVIEKTITPSFLKCFFIIIAYNMFYILLSRDLSSSYLLWFLWPLLLMVLLANSLKKTNRTSKFMLSYSNVLCILAVISLFFYLFGEITHIIPSSEFKVFREERNKKKKKSYFGLSFIGQTQTILGITLPRNTGLFLEGPSWGGILWYALFLELFIRNKISNNFHSFH